MTSLYTKIKVNDNDYMIMNIKHRDWNLPVLLDEKDGEYIISLNKKWKCTDRGLLYCTHESKGFSHDIYMHDIIIAKKMKESGMKLENKPILHINKIGFDNRRNNLIYDSVNKDISKNIKKKKRIINLPDDVGFNVDDIPTYVWYLKPNDSHGERFIIEVADVAWKTGSSKLLSLKYKFEEAKKFLRELKEERPELFDDYCMNGEFTQLGKQLYDSYYEIIKKVGYNNEEKSSDKITDMYLEEDLNGLTNEEINLLHSKTFYGNPERITRKIINPQLLKKKCLKIKGIPEFCYYKKATEKRGDYFIISGHPKLDSEWRTTTSKYISTKDKIKTLLLKIKELEK